MAYPQQKSGLCGHETADWVTGCGCFRWFCFEAAAGNHFLLQERGLGPQKETWVLEKFKNFTIKIGELCDHKKWNNKQRDQFHYSPETYELNFAGEPEKDDDIDLLHSFSSRFTSRPLISDQQRKMAAF